MQQRYCQTSILAKKLKDLACFLHQSSLPWIWIFWCHGIFSISWKTRDLAFCRHWQNVYGAISREKHTALRCKEWCFNEFFFPNEVFDGQRQETSLLCSSVSECVRNPRSIGIWWLCNLCSLRFMAEDFSFHDFWDTWRPAWFRNRACALENDSHFDVPSGKMGATGEAVSSLHDPCKTKLSPSVVWLPNLDFVEKIWLWRCLFEIPSSVAVLLYWLPGRQVERWI